MDLKHYPTSLEDWQNRVVRFVIRSSEEFDSIEYYTTGDHYYHNSWRLIKDIDSFKELLETRGFTSIRLRINHGEITVSGFGVVSNAIQNRIFISNPEKSVVELIHECFQTTYDIESIDLEGVISYLYASAQETQKQGQFSAEFFERLKQYTEDREKSIAGLEEKRSANVTTISTEYRKNIDQLTTAYQTTIAELKKQHQSSEQTHQKTIDQYVSNTTKEYRENIAQLTQTYRQTIEELQQHQEHSDKVRQETIERYEKEYDQRAQRRVDATEKRFERRKINLENKYQEKKQKLDERWSQRQIEIKRAHDKLEARALELDAVDSKSVRRSIRKDIKKNIQKDIDNPELSKSTNKKRWFVTGMLWALIVIELVAAGLYQAYASPTPPAGVTVTAYAYMDFIAFYLRQTRLIIAAVATGFYYIKWQDKWSAQHADREFGLKQFQLDMERASWVVEMALEWKQETQNELPEQLSKQLTANLFEQGQTPLELQSSPADHIASALLGSASKLDLNVQGQKLTLDRKGVQQLQQPTVTTPPPAP